MSTDRPDTTTYHRFAVGRIVRISGGLSARNAAAGTYKVVAQLPERDGALQYRIKSEREPFQRIIKEDELDAA